MDAVLALKTVIMGVVEGLTEFLPISSTGHLIVAGRAIGFEESLNQALGPDLGPKAASAFEIIIQLGAILAVCWYFRRRIATTLGTVSEEPTRRFILSLLVAFLPAAVIGFAIHRHLETLLRPEVVAATTIIGGILIILIERRRAEPRFTSANDLPLRIALIIGFCQCLAMIPGTSRSGATIMGALLLGVSRVAATEFSFFLAIPTMMAATALQLVKHRHDLTHQSLLIIAIGFVVSFIVALGVVHWLLKFVSSHRFTAFGWYRIVAGCVLVGLILAGWITAAGTH